MDYACNIAVNQGIDALKERCRRNADTYVPCFVDDQVVKEFTERAKHSCMFTEMALFMYCLHDKFGWGQKRLQELLDEFVKMSDVIWYKWLDFKDITKAIREETGIDLSPYMPLAFKASMEIDKVIEEDTDGYQPGFEPKEGRK